VEVLPVSFSDSLSTTLIDVYEFFRVVFYNGIRARLEDVYSILVTPPPPPVKPPVRPPAWLIVLALLLLLLLMSRRRRP
jgi:hypothetical protein